MVILLIIGLLVLIAGLVLYAFDKNWLALWFAIYGTFIFTGALILLMENDKPSALDVYRGKTTLEITYKDSIAVDSVVVFKD